MERTVPAMDRITTVADSSENAIVLNNSTPGIWRIEMYDNNTYVIYGFAADRLAAYEDTGLSPKEITALIADNKRLHRHIDEIESTVKRNGNDR